MQTGFAIPLALILKICILGVTLDNISTYCFAKLFGIENFFFKEQNQLTKQCVKKFGLAWGLLVEEVHPKRLFCNFILIGAFGLVTVIFFNNTNFNLLSFFIPGLLFIGSEHIVAALNNFNMIRTDYRLIHPTKSFAKEES